MAVETSTSDLVMRFAKIGGRLQSHATALQGVGVTGGLVAFIAGVVMASQTRVSDSAPSMHPHAALGFALALAGVLFGVFTVVLSFVVAALADYVSSSHLIEISDR
jgi:hypothetical protein